MKEVILDLYDKDFLRIGKLSKLKYLEYTTKLSDAGNFKMTVPIDENISSLLQSRYILIDEETLAEVLYFYPSQEDPEFLSVEGRIATFTLSKRTFGATKNYSGTISHVLRQMITDGFIDPDDSRNYTELISLSEEEKYIPDSDFITLQRTGGNLLEGMQSIVPDNMGFNLTPVLRDVYSEGTLLRNIESLEFRVLKGKDKTVYNEYGNEKVAFSYSLNNLLSSNYTKDRSSYANVAIVAGEGEGVNRVITETGDSEVTGLDRVEVFVDARELQSITSSGELTEEEYILKLKNKGDSELKNHKEYETFEATVNVDTSIFVYGEDFFLGDTVTIEDEKLQKILSAVVTAVRIVLDESGQRTDITFGYRRLSNVSILKQKGVL